MLAIMALLAPGTGVLEVSAVIGLILAGYVAAQLPVNFWALGVLLLGVVPFLLALRKSRQLVFLGISILALVVGSVFLFHGVGLRPAVNPVLALIVSSLSAGYLWIAARKILETEFVRPSHDLTSLIGVVGEAKTDIKNEGSVQILGELWSARSKQFIPEGSSIRVIGREGFVLEVEPAEQVELQEN